MEQDLSLTAWEKVCIPYCDIEHSMIITVVDVAGVLLGGVERRAS